MVKKYHVYMEHQATVNVTVEAKNKEEAEEIAYEEELQKLNGLCPHCSKWLSLGEPTDDEAHVVEVED